MAQDGADHGTTVTEKEGNVLADCRELFNHLSELEVQLAAAVALQSESEVESREAHCGEIARCEEEHAQLKERARLLKESSQATVQQFLARIGPLLQAHQDLKEEFSRVNKFSPEPGNPSQTNGNAEEVGGILDMGNLLHTDSEPHLVERSRSACADEAAGEPMASYPPSLGSSRCPLELTVVGSPEEESAARQDAILAAARALLGQSQRVEEELAAEEAAADARACRPRFLDANPSTGNLPMYTPRVLPPGVAMPEVESTAGMFAGAEDRPFCGSGNMRVMRTSSLQPYAMGYVHQGDAFETALQAPIVSTPTVQAPPLQVFTPRAGMGRPQSAPRYAVTVPVPQVIQRVVLPRVASPRPVQASERQDQPRFIAPPKGAPTTHAIVRTSSPMHRSAEMVHTVGRVASSPRPGRPIASPAPICPSSTLVTQSGRPRSVSPHPQVTRTGSPRGRPAAVVYAQGSVDAAHWEAAVAAPTAPDAGLSPRLVEVQSRPTELSPRHYRTDRGAAPREISPGPYRVETAAPTRGRELSPVQYRSEATAPARELSPGQYRQEVAAPPQVPQTARVAGSMTPAKYRPKAGASSPGVPALPTTSHVVRFSSGPSGTVTKAHWPPQAAASPGAAAGSVRLTPYFPKRSGSVNVASGGGKSASTKLWL
mmetsp:Transcript_43038/g.77232  ORF Transcript_43038/g.77232 Transcript_43038/m.77232 type:complete len:657 (-) Transcript_43038:88-2058(-)